MWLAVCVLEKLDNTGAIDLAHWFRHVFHRR